MGTSIFFPTTWQVVSVLHDATEHQRCLPGCHSRNMQTFNCKNSLLPLQLWVHISTPSRPLSLPSALVSFHNYWSWRNTKSKVLFLSEHFSLCLLLVLLSLVELLHQISSLADEETLKANFSSCWSISLFVFLTCWQSSSTKYEESHKETLSISHFIRASLFFFVFLACRWSSVTKCQEADEETRSIFVFVFLLLQAKCFHQMWRGWCYVPSNALLMLLYKQEFHLKGLLMLPKDTRIHVNAIQVRIHLDAIQMLL